MAAGLVPAHRVDSSFTTLRGSAPERLLEGRAEAKLMTWNVYGLDSDMLPWIDRVKLIADKILDANADIVVLEECFDDLAPRIWEHIRSVYANGLYHSQHETQRSSGLAVFSKLPFGDVSFEKHLNFLYKKPLALMGTIFFSLLGKKGTPVAAIAASHFQGSSSCQWRVGVTQAGERLSYEEARRQQAETALKRLAPAAEQRIPTYFCGDCNVERKGDSFQSEYALSPLNPEKNPLIRNPMSKEMHNAPTNTNFWVHHAKIKKLYPGLTPHEVSARAIDFERFCNTTLNHYLLETSPWKDKDSFTRFDPSWLNDLALAINPQDERDRGALDYFCKEALNVVESEKELWKEHANEGEVPPVSIGWVLWSRGTPILESLDYILGVGKSARIKDLSILEGFTTDLETTASDHHPVIATIETNDPDSDESFSV